MTITPRFTLLTTWNTCMGLHWLYCRPSQQMLSKALSKTPFLCYSMNKLFWVVSILHCFCRYLQILLELPCSLYFILNQIYNIKMHPSCPGSLQPIQPSTSTPWKNICSCHLWPEMWCLMCCNAALPLSHNLLRWAWLGICHWPSSSCSRWIWFFLHQAEHPAVSMAPTHHISPSYWVPLLMTPNNHLYHR